MEDIQILKTLFEIVKSVNVRDWRGKEYLKNLQNLKILNLKIFEKAFISRTINLIKNF